jgi:hypothetical protein
MAFLGETFGVDDLPQSDRNYELIPEGWYNVTITKAELGNTKSGTGQKIDVRYDITGPTQQGRVIFQAVNIRNQSQKAEEIGRQQLGEIMRAIGLARVEDTDQLIGGQLCIKIKIRQPTDRDKAAGYTEDKNEVAGFKAVSGGIAPKPAPNAAPAASSAPGGSKPPWAK